MFLVDTDVISIGSPSKKLVAAPLVGWMDENSDRLFVSSITIAEIEDGIAKVRREGAQRKAALLEEWLETILYLYNEKVLPFDVPAARIAGRLSDQARAKGLSPGFADLAIAATAAAHRMTVLTGNVRHFAPLGVAVQNPFITLPD